MKKEQNMFLLQIDKNQYDFIKGMPKLLLLTVDHQH